MGSSFFYEVFVIASMLGLFFAPFALSPAMWFLPRPRLLTNGFFSRILFFNMNQVAQGNAHEVRCDPVIRLYINKVSIATSTWLLVKPNKNSTTNLLNYLQRDWRSRTEITVTLSRKRWALLIIRDVTRRCVRESLGNRYSCISASSQTVSE